MSEIPTALHNLLAEDSPSDGTWAAFTREYSRLLLHVARSTCHDHDESMDAYAYLLEKLSEDSCRRLRAYSVDPRSKFTTWLVVVARRICLDYQRTLYGRLRNDESETERARLGIRRNLVQASGDTELIDSIPDDTTTSPGIDLERQELSSALSELRGSLPAADRLLLALRFDDGLPIAEIAVILGYPSQFHVYRRIKSVLGDMKAQLEARGHEKMTL